MAELEHDTLDMIILTQINAHHFSEDLQGHDTAGETKKDYTHFYFHIVTLYVWQPYCFYME